MEQGCRGLILACPFCTCYESHFSPCSPCYLHYCERCLKCASKLFIKETMHTCLLTYLLTCVCELAHKKACLWNSAASDWPDQPVHWHSLSRASPCTCILHQYIVLAIHGKNNKEKNFLVKGGSLLTYFLIGYICRQVLMTQLMNFIVNYSERNCRTILPNNKKAENTVDEV